MTALDEWDQPIVDDFRRDRWDRPLILQPDGRRIGYTRSSTAAKTIEDTYNLQQWALRNVAYGMAYDASLVARLIALGGNPAVWDKPTKQAVQKVCADAEGIAQAHKGADIGSALHHLTHRNDRGEDVDAGPYQADLEAYRETMFGHQIERPQEYIECRIVNDLLRMAGSADRIVYADGVYRIADIKTGQTVDFGGLGWSAQLAAYAGGQLYDVATEQRMPTPPIDQQVGYIIHLPAGQGRCDIYEVDLVAGHRAAELANEIRAIRKASKQWISPKSTWVAAPVSDSAGVVERQAAGVASITAPAAQNAAPSRTIPPRGPRGPDPARYPEGKPRQRKVAAPRSSPVERLAGDVESPSPADTSAAPPLTPSAGAQQAPTPPPGVGATTAAPAPDPASRRQALLDRYHALGELDRKRFDVRKPTPGFDDDLYLDLVESLLAEIEATAANRPNPNPPAAVESPSPPTPDEGDLVADVDIAALKFNYDNLTAEAKTWVATLVAEGHTAGVPLHTGGLHSRRRYELGRAIVRLAGEFGHSATTRPDVIARLHADIIRGLLGEATDREDAQDDMPLGAAIGTCDAAEATRFAALVDEYLSPNSAA